MRTRMTVYLIIGIACMIAGMIFTRIQGVPDILPSFLVAFGFGLIAIVISTRGGRAVRDEMTSRVESLSGRYTFVLTLYFIFALSIVNYVIPALLSVEAVLLAMMLFMSVAFLVIRYMLLKRGKAE